MKKTIVIVVAAVVVVAVVTTLVALNIWPQTVTGSLTAGNIEFDISGASTVQLDGSANDIDANLSGASQLNLEDFPVNNADINFSGASSGTVNLGGSLDANLSGASRLWYIGEPTSTDINTSGASTVSKK
jgi:hypothetical protein